jgi:hypothetical protein
VNFLIRSKFVTNVLEIAFGDRLRNATDLLDVRLGISVQKHVYLRFVSQRKTTTVTTTHLSVIVVIMKHALDSLNVLPNGSTERKSVDTRVLVEAAEEREESCQVSVRVCVVD